MQNYLETYAREYDDRGLAVYDSRLDFLDCNLAFKKFFPSSCEHSLSNLFIFITGTDDILSQMMISVEMNSRNGVCDLAFNSNLCRREFKVNLIATGEEQARKYICSFEDITEFVFFQKVLVNRSSCLENLDRNSPVGVFKSSATGSVLYVNNGLVAMLGYDNEQQLYNVELSNVWAILSHRKKLLALLKKDKTVNGFETKWQRKNKSHFWVSLTATCHYNKNGEILYQEVVVIDVDEKKKAEEKLKRSQSKLRSMVDLKTAELKKFNDLMLKEIKMRQRSESIHTVLQAIAEETISVRSLNDLLKLIHHHLSQIMPAPNLYFAFYHKDSKTYTFPYSADTVDDTNSFTDTESMKDSLTDYVRKTGQPLLVNHSSFQKMVLKKLVASTGNPSEQWMGVPLRDSNGVWAVMVVQSYRKKNVFSPSQLTMFSNLSEIISMAICRFNLEHKNTKSDILFKTLINHIQRGIVVYDSSDRIIFANEVFSTVADVPLEQLINMDIGDVISEEETAQTVANSEDGNKTKQSSHQPALIITKGEVIPVTVCRIPVSKGENGLQRTVLIFDRTKREE